MHRTAQEYLQLATDLVLDKTNYTQDREARTRQLVKAAEVAAFIQKRSPEISSNDFRNFLRTGQVRSGISGEGPTGGAFPGSTSGYTVPVEFVHSVVNSMAFI